MARLLRPQTPVRILSSAAVGGYEERQGRFGSLFDYCCEDDLFGKDCFEDAEGEMARMALSFALGKEGMGEASLGLLLAGDLQNQCVASSAGPASCRAPFLGLFGACSTLVEGLGVGMLALSGCRELSTVAAVASSHNAAAERQFRTPLEYGGQRTPTAQWTATAAGAVLLGREGGSAAITGFLPGRTVDTGLSDAANMGAAMAPAAADTLLSYFEESGTNAQDYDLILTGDLGSEGSVCLSTLIGEKQPNFTKVHADGGCLLYDREKKDVHAGASGCGCVASMLAAVYLPQLARGELSRILAVGTGALMNPQGLRRGGSIVGIAHLVCIERG